MNLDECRAICTSPQIPTRKKLFFRIIYEPQLRPFEALNLLIENWDREQKLVTAVRVKQKTAPVKGDRHRKMRLPSKPKTAFITENTNLMLKTVVSNCKKRSIFVNANGDKLSIAWFKDRINHYLKLLGIQKDVKYYDTGTGEVHPRDLITCMALRETGEQHHDNAGGPGNYRRLLQGTLCSLIKMKKKATTLIFKSNDVFQKSYTIPWLGNKRLRFDWIS
ncbi:MAG TPA: hypothetical protein VKL21_06075 [Candidatus Methanoperedens sp.]|nr:hypothetical protein [Candidatus Methanoperedens sp.]